MQYGVSGRALDYVPRGPGIKFSSRQMVFFQARQLFSTATPTEHSMAQFVGNFYLYSDVRIGHILVQSTVKWAPRVRFEVGREKAEQQSVFPGSEVQ